MKKPDAHQLPSGFFAENQKPMTSTLHKPRAVFFVVAFVTLFALIAFADELQGRVVAIADGDTITVLDASETQHKVRLKSIDAPERAQAFGQASKRNLSAIIFGKLVTVEFSKRDRYGRIIGRVLLDGQDICLAQVASGYAWHYTEYEREQSPSERKAYAEAEAEAREQKRGLWRDPSPVAPWEYRREQRRTR